MHVVGNEEEMNSDRKYKKAKKTHRLATLSWYKVSIFTQASTDKSYANILL